MPTLLVIDDNDSVRKTLRHIIERSGYTVLVGDNGTSGLALFDQSGADAAIVDINMPGIDGIEVCRQLKERTAAKGQNFPVWLMTGAPGADVERLAAEAGAIAVLHKPFDIPRLLREITERLKGVPQGQDSPVGFPLNFRTPLP